MQAVLSVAVVMVLMTSFALVLRWGNLILSGFMVFVGVIFVTNSLDSLTRLYTDNLGLTVEKFGRFKYVAMHWGLLCSLILFYQFTPLQIEWIGLVVIGLYALIAILFLRRRVLLAEILSTAEG